MQLTGLTSNQVKEKLAIFGLNEIKDINKKQWYNILLGQIKSNFVIYLLALAMFISFFVHEIITGYTILAIIVIVIAVGFLQEYKSEKAVEALKNMVTSTSIVIRDSKKQEILSKEIVVEDILLLRTGDKIPADCIILEQNNLSVDESVLTGESKEIKKIEIKCEDNYDDENKVFAGTFIVNGKCTVKVTHTGMNTKFGKIANLISTTEKELPLQKKINKICKIIAIVGIISAITVAILVLINARQITQKLIIEVLILTIAVSISAFPEGFPVVLISTLSFGAYRMAKNNAIVNRMSIIETLGETTVICSDKTGTITKGEMTVKEIYANNSFIEITGAGYEKFGEFIIDKKAANIKKINLESLLKTAVLCNNAFIKEETDNLEYKINGSPTESSLLVMGAKAGIFKEDFNLEIIDEIPFCSDRKMMSVICCENDEKYVYVKGAPEIIINKSISIEINGKVSKLNDKEKAQLLKINSDMNRKALRTIALAYKKFDKKNNEEDLVFLGIVGIEDPPRNEVFETIKLCTQAGIKIKMITGDHKETAESIAKQIGLNNIKIMQGFEIDEITDEELKDIINEINVFARVRPEHKLRIVRALKANGEIVAMTGDGVNDAPALKEAHVGIAMGKSGTDVSRSVADLILKDDNFSTIVSAIKEGRTIFSNIRKFISYQLSCNVAELILIVGGVAIAAKFNWPIPLLLPLHILFMNIVTDELPAITLGLNPYSKDIMEEKPRKKKNILTKNLIYLFMFSGIIMGLLVLSVFYFVFNILNLGEITSRTIALVSLIFIEISAAYTYRSFRKLALTRSLLVNKYLFFASILSIIATLVIIYTPVNKSLAQFLLELMVG
ncbi:MAG: cation-transporting P-type ATPase [archaeon]